MVTEDMAQTTVIPPVWEMWKSQVSSLQVFKRIYFAFDYVYVWGWERTQECPCVQRPEAAGSYMLPDLSAGN